MHKSMPEEIDLPFLKVKKISQKINQTSKYSKQAIRNTNLPDIANSPQIHHYQIIDNRSNNSTRE
jgi:hypothetical protein